jgi:hypothetical protein
VVSKLANAADSAKAELAQFDSFHAAPAPTATGAHGTPPAQTRATPAPATVKSSEGAPATVAAAPPKSTPALPATASPESAAHAAQPTPVAQAVALRAAPMTPQQQVDVLHLVMELGVLIRDQRTEIAALHAQVLGLSGTVNTKLIDFDRRLSLAEARGAIAAAMGASVPQSPAAGQNAPAPVTAESVAMLAPHRNRLVAKPAPQAPAQVTIRRSVADYHIQAASPGLAMLSRWRLRSETRCPVSGK